MTGIATKLEELELQKELIWDALLCSKYDSPEGRKISEQYIDICRKIRRLKMEDSK